MLSGIQSDMLSENTELLLKIPSDKLRVCQADRLPSTRFRHWKK